MRKIVYVGQSMHRVVKNDAPMGHTLMRRLTIMRYRVADWLRLTKRERLLILRGMMLEQQMKYKQRES